MKRIRLNHASNVRDLGGFETTDGYTTKWQTIYRGDALYNLSAEEWKKLYKAGVCTVVDLRSSAEKIKYPDRPLPQIKVFDCPMQKEDIDDSNLVQTAERAFTSSLALGYCKMVEETPELLINALRVVISSLKNGAVLFHCTAGKDRTGVLAAVILELVGVTRPDIIADYEVSYTYDMEGLFKYFSLSGDMSAIEPLLHSNRDNMLSLFDCFDRIHLVSYLKDRGFGADEIKELRRYFLEDGIGE